MGGRAVECIGLENRRLFTESVSSNLTPSAKTAPIERELFLSAGNMHKTNALRMLDQAKISYRVIEYQIKDEKIDAVSVAAKIGRSPDTVFKTLVTASPAREYFVFVIPGAKELDLKAAAVAAGQKRIEMLPLKELFPLTSYIHGGCSPVGMKKPFPTFIDESALALDSFCVSGGKIGINIELAPKVLANFINASFAPLTRNNQ